ncbi:hypothetical protein Lser_V15G24582 [Lactuca serriola]
MSDQHKGLLEAVKEILPTAEHRQCARHTLANFRKRFTGVHYEKMFWRPCKASTEPLFNAAMKEIQILNPVAFEYLMEKNPISWCRAFFQEGTMCDAFNLSMKGSAWPEFKPCPTIRTLLNKLKKAQRYYQVLPTGLNQFETRNLAESYVVDLDKKTWSCRVWQLNGYGCVYSVETISFLNRNVGSYVDPMYFGAFYRNTYKYPMKGMNGSNMWPCTNYSPPLPPLRRKLSGRPKVNRRKDLSKKATRHTVSKVGKRILCSMCKEVGHNKVVEQKNEGSNPGEGGSGTKTNEGSNGGEGGSGTKTNERGNKCEGGIGKQPKGKDTTRKMKYSERIIKKKLGKRVEGKNGEDNTSANPLDIE